MRRSPATILSFSSLLVLIIIQVYVVFSHYKAKSRIFDMTYSKAILSTVENNINNLTTDLLDIAFNEAAASFLLQASDTVNPTIHEKILNRFDSLLYRYDENSIKVKNYLAGHKLDTIFKSQYRINEISFLISNNKIIVYRNQQNKEPEQNTRGIYIKTYYREGDYYAIQYDYFVDLSHRPKLILAEMKGLLLMVILTIAVVILTFLYTLSTLGRQKKLSELKDDFIDNITHEFKTPLSVISVAVSSLRQQQVRDDRQKFTETCNTLEKQNRFLSKMIDNVIDISLLDRNSINYIKKPVALKPFMEETIHSFISSNETLGKKVQISEQYFIPDDYLYNIDAVQFSRAVNNLLGNAVKYCDHEPAITVNISVDHHLKIEIKDNGIGIREEKLPFVFKKFYRADNPARVKGLGLGLYIVKRIVENHQGTIQLQSKWGKGTKVIISLPKQT